MHLTPEQLVKVSLMHHHGYICMTMLPELRKRNLVSRKEYLKYSQMLKSDDKEMVELACTIITKIIQDDTRGDR